MTPTNQCPPRPTAYRKRSTEEGGCGREGGRIGKFYGLAVYGLFSARDDKAGRLHIGSLTCTIPTVKQRYGRFSFLYFLLEPFSYSHSCVYYIFIFYLSTFAS